MKRTDTILWLVLASGLLMGGVPVKRGPSTFVIPAGANPPATCAVGELFLDTDELNDTNCATLADNSICACHAPNTWDTTE